MTIAFTIPVWVFWLLGVPLGLVLLFFMFTGVVVVWSILTSKSL
ncbi:MAG: hypothetical protein ABS894_00555 [Aerococcus urinaeequi]